MLRIKVRLLLMFTCTDRVYNIYRSATLYLIDPVLSEEKKHNLVNYSMMKSCIYRLLDMKVIVQIF